MSAEIWKERRLSGERREKDVRDEWERDYARIIHSSAFRRLQAKTQVLGLGESDFYRTRLTHSMEVAQIGSGIVRWLEKCYEGDGEIFGALPHMALMNSICLAHDLGHPPFGHGGEVALNICMRDHGGFEGNGQTLRILSRLDKYTNGFGMNPTRRLLLGILKYPAAYSASVKADAYAEVKATEWLSRAKNQKPPKCYLDSDEEVVDWILGPLVDSEKAEFCATKDDPRESKESTMHKRPIHKALDTSIMELADDISYSLHDLEDAISLGMISRDDWRSHNEGESDVFLECGLGLDELTEKLFSKESHLRKKAIGSLVHCFIVNTYVDCSKLSKSTVPLIKWNAFMRDPQERLKDHIFDLVVKKVIKSPGVQQLEFKGQRLVIELFNALNSDPDRLLPLSTKERYQAAEGRGEKERVVCDYVSGMTDDYATRLYEKIFHPHKGSIFDRL